MQNQKLHVLILIHSRAWGKLVPIFNKQITGTQSIFTENRNKSERIKPFYTIKNRPALFKRVT